MQGCSSVYVFIHELYKGWVCCLGRIRISTSDPLRSNSLGRIHFQIRDLLNQLWTSIHRITDPSDPKIDLIGLMTNRTQIAASYTHLQFLSRA